MHTGPVKGSQRQSGAACHTDGGGGRSKVFVMSWDGNIHEHKQFMFLQPSAAEHTKVVLVAAGCAAASSASAEETGENKDTTNALEARPKIVSG